MAQHNGRSGFLQLYFHDGMLCLRATKESRKVGMLQVKFRTPSGKVARLELTPAALNASNEYYAIERLILEDGSACADDGLKQRMGED